MLTLQYGGPTLALLAHEPAAPEVPPALTLTPTLALTLTLTLTQVQRPLAAGAQGAVRGQRSAQRCGAVPEWW